MWGYDLNNISLQVQVNNIIRRIGQKELSLILPGIWTNGRVRAKPYFSSDDATNRGGNTSVKVSHTTNRDNVTNKDIGNMIWQHQSYNDDEMDRRQNFPVLDELLAKASYPRRNAQNPHQKKDIRKRKGTTTYLAVRKVEQRKDAGKKVAEENRGKLLTREENLEAK